MIYVCSQERKLLLFCIFLFAASPSLLFVFFSSHSYYSITSQSQSHAPLEVSHNYSNNNNSNISNNKNKRIYSNTNNPSSIGIDVLKLTQTIDDVDKWDNDEGDFMRFVTLVYEGADSEFNIQRIRSLVGSIHMTEPSSHITVYGYNLKWDHYLEIRTFQRVHYVNLHKGYFTEAAEGEHVSYARARDVAYAHASKAYKRVLFIGTQHVVRQGGLSAWAYHLASPGNIVVVKTKYFFFTEVMENIFGSIAGTPTPHANELDYDQYFAGSDEELGKRARCELSMNMTSPFRSEFVYAHNNPEYDRKEKDINSTLIQKSICMCVATYSGNKDIPLSKFSLLKVFMKSFLKSTEKDDTPSTRYRFALYLGTQPDKFFDNPDTLHDLSHEILKMAEHRSFSLRIFKIPLNVGTVDVTYKWNVLIDQAYRDGCDYFYQYSDDAALITPWANTFVTLLEANKDFGIAGALDENNRDVMTLSFTSRLHIQMLGTYWPEQLKNWYSDVWAQQVYGSRYTYWSADHRVRIINTQSHGQRYSSCNHLDVMWKQLTIGRKTIVWWLKFKSDHKPWTKKVLDYYGQTLSKETNK